MGPPTAKLKTPWYQAVCPGVWEEMIYTHWNGAKLRPVVVSDIDGDGKPDIILFDPDRMLIAWLTTNDSYQGERGFAVGSRNAVLL